MAHNRWREVLSCQGGLRFDWEQLVLHPHDQPRSEAKLLGIYLNAVSRGANLPLDVGPDKHGLIPDRSAAALAPTEESGSPLSPGRSTAPLVATKCPLAAALRVGRIPTHVPVCRGRHSARDHGGRVCERDTTRGWLLSIQSQATSQSDAKIWTRHRTSSNSTSCDTRSKPGPVNPKDFCRLASRYGELAW